MGRPELFPYNAGLYTDKLGYSDFQPKKPGSLAVNKTPGHHPPLTKYSLSLSLRRMTLEAIVFCQEIGSVPINDSPFRFFLRMDVEFVKDHQLLVLQVVQRPYLFLAVG